MIRRPRGATVPAILRRQYDEAEPPKATRLLVEEDRIRARLEAFVEAVVAEIADDPALAADPAKHGIERLAGFSYDYAHYKHEDIKEALHGLFHGKCAYCESRYAGTQPMDVEHWRPKGKVVRVLDEDGDRVRHEEYGYYWLAANWENLYPSCIDCNRARTQKDASSGQTRTLGKANQFPIERPEVRRFWLEPDQDAKRFVERLRRSHLEEAPLLLDPCLDDPAEYLHFDEEGVVHPASNAPEIHGKATRSIEVFALNRSELVAERRARRELVDQRMSLILELKELRDQLAELDLGDVLDDLITHEIDLVIGMAADDQPFAGMVRQMLADAEAVAGDG